MFPQGCPFRGYSSLRREESIFLTSTKEHTRGEAERGIFVINKERRVKRGNMLMRSPDPCQLPADVVGIAHQPEQDVAAHTINFSYLTELPRAVMHNFPGLEATMKE